MARRYIAGRLESYEFDVADNLVAQPRLNRAVLDQGNRLKAANGLSFDYNDRNHVAVRETSDGAVRYIYDSRDQLVRVESLKGTWEAEYDALGRRTRKTWAGQTTEYYWNGDQLIAEVAADGHLRIYVYADPLALTPLLFLDYDSITASVDSCRRYFLFADQIGTPCAVEEDSGANVWRARIDPFGHAEIASGGKIECNLRFPGHYFDAELDLHYNRFRYFDPVLGRYIQSDPWGIAGGFNLYAYCSNPLLRVDVRGLGEDPEKPEPDPTKSTGDAEKSLPAATRAAADEAREMPKETRPTVMTGMKTPDGEITTGGSYRGPREEYTGLEGAPKTQAAYEKAAAEVRPPAGASPEEVQRFPQPEQSGRCGEAQRMAGYERETGEMPPPGTEFHSDKVGGPNSPSHGEDKAACPYCSHVMNEKGYESSSGTSPYDTVPPSSGTPPPSGDGSSPAPGGTGDSGGDH